MVFSFSWSRTYHFVWSVILVNDIAHELVCIVLNFARFQQNAVKICKASPVRIGVNLLDFSFDWFQWSAAPKFSGWDWIRWWPKKFNGIQVTHTVLKDQKGQHITKWMFENSIIEMTRRLPLHVVIIIFTRNRARSENECWRAIWRRASAQSVYALQREQLRWTQQQWAVTIVIPFGRNILFEIFNKQKWQSYQRLVYCTLKCSHAENKTI